MSEPDWVPDVGERVAAIDDPKQPMVVTKNGDLDAIECRWNKSGTRTTETFLLAELRPYKPPPPLGVIVAD